MNNLYRRAFLKACGTAALAAALPSLSRAATPAPGKKNPVILFSKHVSWLPTDDIGPYLRDLGFDGVELAVRPGGHVLPAEAARKLPGVVASIRRAGLTVPGMVSGITTADDPVTSEVLRAAADSGIEYYRLAYYNYDAKLGVKGTLDQLKPTVAKLAQLNERIGIHGAWQNHDGARPGSSVWDIWYVIEDLNPRWLGIQFDPRHAVVEGGNSWINDFDFVKDRVRCTIAKDFHWDRNPRGGWTAKHVPLGEGMVNFDLFYQRFVQAGMSGPVSLHVEFPMFDRDEKSLSRAELDRDGAVVLRRELASLRGYLDKAGLNA